MADLMIHMRDVSKSYKGVAGLLTVLRHVDLEIRAGEFVALLGPSGSGKSTLLNMVTAVDRPDEGEVIVNDMNITRKRNLTRWRARNVGIVFQNFQLLPTLTVVENVMMPMDFANVHKARDRREIALDLLDRFGVVEQADKTPDLLSGGQQQRVAIARALANTPRIIIGDEPTANLDHMSAQVVFEEFQRLADQGSTILIVTHDRDLVQSVPRLLTLQDGYVEADTADHAGKTRTDELRRISTQEVKKLSTRELRQVQN